MGIGGDVRVVKQATTIRFVLVMIALAMLIIGGPWAWVRAMAAGRVSDVASAPTVPVAVVLGAGVNPDGSPSPYLKSRLDLAYDLYQDGTVRAILVSGDNSVAHYDEPTAMRRYLIARGVPERQVIADFAGFDTYDTCVRAKKIFGVDQAIMISQRYHVYRAVATCRAVGVDAHGVGDETGRQHARVWQLGVVREKAANLKMVWDLITRRTPTLGPYETSVDEALR